MHGKGSLLDKQPGDRWQRFANLRCLLAWQWCHPGRQLLFMGGELAQEREWSHDRELDWWLLARADHAGVTELVADLNALQAARPALWVGRRRPGRLLRLARRGRPPALGVHLLARRARTASGGEDSIVVVAANLTPVPRHGYRLGVPRAGRVAGAAGHRCRQVRRVGPRGRALRRGRAPGGRLDPLAGSAGLAAAHPATALSIGAGPAGPCALTPVASRP